MKTRIFTIGFVLATTVACATVRPSYKENRVRRQVSVLVEQGQPLAVNGISGKDLEDVIEVHAKSLQQDKNDKRTRVNLASLYYLSGEYDKALKQARRILIQDERNLEAVKIVARIHYLKKRYRLVHLICSNAIFKGSRDSEILNLMGLAHMNLGNEVEAIRSFKKALAVDSRNMASLMNLGIIYLSYKDYNNAGIQFKRVLMAMPTYLPAVSALATVSFQKGNYQGAITGYQQVLAAVPNHPVALYNMGLIYKTKMGDPKKAIEHFDDFIVSPKVGRRQIEMAYKHISDIREQVAASKTGDSDILRMADNIKERASENKKQSDDAVLGSGLGFTKKVKKQRVSATRPRRVKKAVKSVKAKGAVRAKKPANSALALSGNESESDLENMLLED